MTSTRRLDPDRLAALEEERDFLLTSLDDLEAERSAGDLDEADYDALKDDYTRRAAEVIRSIESQEAAFRSVPRAGWKQAGAWLLGLAILGGLSGALIARSSGARGTNDTISGDVRESTITLLVEAGNLQADPERWPDAVELYGRVLEEEPTNVEALTYRAWITYRLDGEPDAVLGNFEEVGRLDPDFPDAIVFHTVVLADAERYPEAAAVLDRLDLATAPGQISALLAQRGLVGEVFGEASYALLVGPDQVTLDDLGLDTEQAFAAAEYLFTGDDQARSIAVLKLYRAVSIAEPDNPIALSREARLLVLTREPDLVARAEKLVDRAVTANPRHPEALFSRASILAQSDPATACGDLDTLLGLDTIDDQFRAQVADLSDQICA